LGCSAQDRSIISTVDALSQIPSLSDECLLWNSFCSGNGSLINNEFFKVTQALLFQNSYFVDPKEEECLDLESADQLKQLEFIKNWMRSESFGEFKANFQSPRNDPESQGIGLDGSGRYSGKTNDPGGPSVHSARQGVPKSANNHPSVNGSGQSGSSTLSDNTKYLGS